MTILRHWKKILLGAGACFLLAQAIRPSLTNPPVRAEPKWDSPRTRELVGRACFDCHSNQTTYPWYSQIAPVRWLLWDHVVEGREHLNFSDPDTDLDVDGMVDAIRSGDMPLWDYRMLHPASRLTPSEKDSLVVGLLRTFEEADDSTSVADTGSAGDSPSPKAPREEKEDRD
jgi:hypothetical protein